ncbi:LADA_0C06612g1_1 [Lachancea dasiensis]|uniref:LADA_0C06612g1_1 n=1 Tax=Lachancea dasiensis TaxID=1072105 RepID=A0A1G4IZW2_9SACH|nr:LADA_0C06612g1_1 [Lachancea dasiensis]
MSLGDDESCQLLGPVSLFIQSAMGLLAIGGVLLKRRYETPKRRWRVWLFDIGKQVLGSLILHFLNVGISILKQDDQSSIKQLLYQDDGDDSGGDQCDWYFLNLLMDTTLGTLVLWWFLTMLERGFAKLGVEGIESGNYYAEDVKPPAGEDNDDRERFSSHDSFSPPQHREPLFSAFLKQLAVYVCGLSLTKLCVFFILTYFEVVAVWFADLALGWSNPWPNFQVFLVMFVFPVLLNCFQYFCVDSIIKLHPKTMSSSERENFEYIYNDPDNAIGRKRRKNDYGATC